MILTQQSEHINFVNYLWDDAEASTLQEDQGRPFLIQKSSAWSGLENNQFRRETPVAKP